MSRQSQINTFTEGLNKDLNPIVTPNNILTDCLNGTIITYNGNEFALQNDLGNYGFKYSSLSNGYIPVGMKEYANILYIISYNPLLNRVEIGSFPSQKTINEANIKDSNSSFDITLDHNNINLYSEIKSDLTLTSTDKDLILAPGDKYILQISSSDEGNSKVYSDFEEIYNDTLWKHISPYIFTETHRLYNIDGLVDLYTGSIQYPTNENFKSVKWEVPGWLAIKSIVNVMSEFNAYLINPKYFYSSGDILSTTTEVKVQSVFSKNIYNNTVLNSIKNNLRYIVFLDNRPSQYDSSELKNKLIELNNNNNILTDNSSFIKNLDNKSISYNSIDEVIYSNFETQNENDKFYVHLIPTLRVNDNGTIVYIIYDQFYTVLSLYEKQFNSDDIKIGEDEFNYSVDNNSLTLNISINAFPDCKMYKRIRRLPEQTFDGESCNINDMVDIYSNIWEEEYDYNYAGQNIIDIPFTSSSEYISNKYKNDNSNLNNYYEIFGSSDDKLDYNKNFIVGNNSYALNTFDKEDIYELTIRIYYPGVDINSLSKNYIEKTFIIYASDIINYFSSIYDNFNNLDDSGEVLDAYTIFNELDRVIKTTNFDKSDFIYSNNISYYISDNNKNSINLSNIEELNTEDINDEIFLGFFNDLYSNNEFNLNNKELYIGGTSNYKMNKNLNDIISMPLNQYGVVGRMWRNCEYLNNLKISLQDSNNNILDVDISDKDNPNFNIKSEYKISVDNIDSFSKQGASKYITLADVNNSPIDFDDMGNLIIKKALVVVKSHSSPGYIQLGISNTITNKNLLVSFKESTYAGNNEYLLNFSFENTEGQNVKFDVNTGSINELSEEEWNNKLIFNILSEEWAKGSEDRSGGQAKIATTITSKSYCPYLFITNSLLDYAGSDSEKYLLHKDGISFRGGYNISDFYWDTQAIGKRGMVSIIFPGVPNDIAGVIFATDGTEDNKNKGILNALAFYSLICKYVRYASRVDQINFYFPNYINTSPNNNQININKIIYNISGFNYNYPFMNNNIPDNLSNIINDISNSISEVFLDEDFSLNISLINKAFNNTNILQYINNILLNVNNKISEEKLRISNLSDITEGSIYLSWDYKEFGTLDNSLKQLLNYIKYNNGKFYLDARNDYAYKMRVSANHYKGIAYIASFYYNNK